MNNQTLVTGASGHLGYHLVKLLQENVRVKCFVRKTSYIDHLRKLPVEIVYGDLFDKESVKAALEGVTEIFHAGAVFDLSPVDGDQIVETSIEGVRNLFSAIAEGYAGQIRRIVYTSSVETIGVTVDPEKPLDESFNTESFKHPYCKAKNLSEKLALQLAREAEIELVICNPSTIVGSDDFRITPSNRMLLTLAASKAPIYVRSGQNLVWVEDVARGHLLAMKSGEPYERYILCGENISLKGLLAKLSGLGYGFTPMVPLPQAILKALGLLCEWEGKLTGKPPRFSRQRAEGMVGKYTYYHHDKATGKLGYSPHSLDEFLRDTLLWLIAQEERA